MSFSLNYKQLTAAAAILAAMITGFSTIANTFVSHYFDSQESKVARQDRQTAELRAIVKSNTKSLQTVSFSLKTIAKTLNRKADAGEISGKIDRLRDKVKVNIRNISHTSALARSNLNKIQRMKGQLDLSFRLPPDSILLARLPLHKRPTTVAAGLSFNYMRPPADRRRFTATSFRSLEYTL